MIMYVEVMEESRNNPDQWWSNPHAMDKWASTQPTTLWKVTDTM